MIQRIVELIKVDDDVFYLTTSGKLGLAFWAEPFDIEAQPDGFERKIESLLQQFPQDIDVVFECRSQIIHDEPPGHARADAISLIGRMSSKVVVRFEMSIKNPFNILKGLYLKIRSGKKSAPVYSSLIRKMSEAIPRDQFSELGLPLRPLSDDQLQEFFPDDHFGVADEGGALTVSGEYVGFLKLHKLGSEPLSFLTLAERKEQLPVPFEIHTRLRKASSSRLRYSLAQKKKQESGLSSMTSQEKQLAADEALAGIENRGDSYFYFETHVVLKRISPQQLAADIKRAQRELFGCGDFIVESRVGSFESLKTILPGGRLHLGERLMGRDRLVSKFLPIFNRGAREQAPRQSSIAYHRTDFSRDFFDSYSPSRLNGMFNLMGKSGSGKSVLLNMYLRSLSFDPAARIILVDVSGSHSRTVQELGGEIHKIRLDEPSSINPFRHLSEAQKEESVEILRTFISEMMLERGESDLPVKESYHIDQALLAYCESKPSRPSFHDFIQFVFPKGDPQKTTFLNFPRPEHLLRFSKNGVHKNVFSEANGEIKTRLSYFNIDQVMQASNPVIAKAMIAAIMAEFSFLLLKKSREEKLALICDEVPFFVEHCFSSFRLLQKNLRKLRGVLGLVAQGSRDLIVNGDTSLLQHAETNIFLSVDQDKEKFCGIFRMDPIEFDLISGLRTEIGKSSQFYIRGPQAGHVGHLFMTPQEYWMATTHPNDLELIEKIRGIVPYVTSRTLASVLAESQIQKVGEL